MSGYHIGDVTVICGEPPNGNPYKGISLMGKERVDALNKFMRDISQPEFTFWYAPCCGGAERCTRDQVNWETSGINEAVKRYKLEV
jgi:hypothetical protein